MAAQGRPDEAVAYAERCRSPWASETDIDRLCEQILLASGQPEEAYAALRHLGESCRNVSWVVSSGGEEVSGASRPPPSWRTSCVTRLETEGKWFAAAKDAKLFDEAIALANATPCDPKTLTRAARDFAQTNPAFAVEAGLAALRWLVRGLRLRGHSPRCQGHVLPHVDGLSQCRRGRGGPDPHPCPLRRSGRSQRIRRKCHREGSGPGLTRSQRRVQIAA